ncbi:hypothetical protein [Photorhabdus sp. RM323S]|uniref:transcriptional antitermination N peptide n=1 Tax=Photorhabdus sp. RM323S TaxID=3342828 RepID=UPI0036DA196C
MNRITYLPRTGKTNSKLRRYIARGELIARKAAEAEGNQRSVDEIIDSIIKPVDETDVLANLIIALKSNDKPEITGSHCLSNTFLYSVKNKKSSNITAR